MVLRDSEVTKWADAILTEAQTGKLECTVHDNYNEEKKCSLPCLIIHSLLKQINLKHLFGDAEF